MSNLNPGGLTRVLNYLKTWVTGLLNGKANSSHTHTKSNITDFPTLSTVATSGSYNDLSNKPTIPSKTSQLTNDSGFWTGNGGTWNPNANISLPASGNGQEWSFDISRNGKTGCYWHVWDGSLGTLLKVNADDGAVSVPNGYIETNYAFSDQQPAIKVHMNATTATWAYGISVLNAAMTTNQYIFCPIGKAYSTNNCAGLRYQWVGDNSNDNNIGFEFFGCGSPLVVYKDGKVTLSVSPANTDNSTRIATTAFVKAQGYITSSGSCNYANSAGNSDTLDGYHEYSFLRNRGSTSTSGEGTLWAQIGIKEYDGALPDGLSGIYDWGGVVSLAGTNSRFDIYCSHMSSDGNGLYYRSGWGDDKKAWRCFIDSANIGSQSVNYANSSGNADTVDGSHAWQMQTLNSSGGVHGSNDWLMQCQYNVDGDGYFKLYCGDKSIGTKVDRATNAGSSGWADNAGYTNWLRTSSHADHLFHTEWDGSYFWTYVTAGDGGYRAVRVERSNSSGYADSAGGVAWGNVSGRPWALSQFTNDSGFITSAIKESSYDDNGKYCLLHGDLLIQFGTNVFSAQSGNVTFKKAFSSAPIVIVNYGDDVGFGSPCCLDEAYTTYFTAKNAAGSELWRCNWIAIGRA